MTASKLSLAVLVDVPRYVGLGHPHRVAANLAGLGTRTLERYLSRGREAHDAALAAISELNADTRQQIEDLDDEPVPPPHPRDATDFPNDALRTTTAGDLEWTPLALVRGDADPPYTTAILDFVPDDEKNYWRLWRAVKRADAASEAVLLGRIAEEGRGYEYVEERTVEELDGDGKVVRRTVTRQTKRSKSWTANAWLLQNRFPEHYPRFQARPATENPAAEDDALDGIGSLDDEKGAAFAGLDELQNLRDRQEAEAV